MAKSPWWQFDKDDDDQDDELARLEKQALDVVYAIAKRADRQPDAVLNISATLRKISTVAGSQAQTLGLRIATMPRGKKERA